jgi:hypothetical protein
LNLKNVKIQNNGLVGKSLAVWHKAPRQGKEMNELRTLRGAQFVHLFLFQVGGEMINFCEALLKYVTSIDIFVVSMLYFL